MGLKTNTVSPNPVLAERFPRPGPLRGEAEGFLEGVKWFMDHCLGYRFDAEDPMKAAQVEALKKWPPFDPPPQPMKKGESSGL